MVQPEDSKRFIFSNKACDMYPLALDVVNYVSQSAPVNDDILLKLKMILVEFLTNSLKHSGDTETVIEVHLNDVAVIIKKTDMGNRLSFEQLIENHSQPAAQTVDDVIHLYGDHTCALKCKLHNQHKASFFIEDYEADDNVINDISTFPEHFGLMIIAKACHAFEYEYMTHNGTNHFTATLIINK